jgi:hypothetical protein
MEALFELNNRINQASDNREGSIKAGTWTDQLQSQFEQNLKIFGGKSRQLKQLYEKQASQLSEEL